jgi:hypothetical protein
MKIYQKEPKYLLDHVISCTTGAVETGRISESHDEADYLR